MKRVTRIFLAAVLVVLTVSVLAVTAFAAVGAPQNGWYTDGNGVERYSKTDRTLLVSKR